MSAIQIARTVDDERRTTANNPLRRAGDAPRATSFRDRALCETALTHKSWLNEARTAGPRGQRAARVSGRRGAGAGGQRPAHAPLPDSAEGDLSRARAALVSESGLAQGGAARSISALDLPRQAARTDRRARAPSILADALEALMGAIYLDGGFDASRARRGAAVRTALDDVDSTRGSITSRACRSAPRRSADGARLRGGRRGRARPRQAVRGGAVAGRARPTAARSADRRRRRSRAPRRRRWTAIEREVEAVTAPIATRRGAARRAGGLPAAARRGPRGAPGRRRRARHAARAPPGRLRRRDRRRARSGRSSCSARRSRSRPACSTAR